MKGSYLGRLLSLQKLFLKTRPIRRISRHQSGASSNSANSSSSGSSSGSSSTSSGGARLRATSGPSVGKRGLHMYRTALLGGGTLFGLYLFYQSGFSIDRMRLSIDELYTRVQDRNVGDPLPEDLQTALGPSPPEGYISVLLSVEDVLVKRTWNRKFGWVYEPREGAKELLKALLDPNLGVWLTLWSENGMSVANEVTEKLFQELGGSPANTQPLSADHIFLRGEGNEKRKEKRLEYFNRDLSTVLLIDHNKVSEDLNPDNTIIVLKMKDTQTATSTGGDSAPAVAEAVDEPDTTCSAIKALVSRIRDDIQATGVVNVPVSLANIKKQALEAGYSTDTQGLFAFLGKAVEESKRLERERLETGLGGFIRRIIKSQPVLRNKLTTIELASVRPFRDPLDELGHDSLLATRVHDAMRRLLRPQ
jgi:hypothetical protein